MKLTVTLVALLGAVTDAFEEGPLVCISSPPIQLVAGTTNVSAINESLYGKKCRALLQFADPDFVPITYSFTPTIPCSGPRVTSFLVPPGAPNGDARIIWQCKRSSACSFAVVSNGTGDRSLIPEQNGTVACLPWSIGVNASTPFKQQPQPSSTPLVPVSTLLSSAPTAGRNFTDISNQTTPTGITQASTAARTSIPPWTILTITHTVTTLLTTTLTTVA